MEKIINIDNIIRSILAAASIATGYLTNSFGGLIVVLIFLMIFDYITGIMSAYVNKSLESKEGLRGIFKKISFILLVLLGFFADIVVTYLIQKVGIKTSTGGLFGIATTCWLIGNESLSVIENLGEIGVPVPKFLKNAFVRIKDISEDIPVNKK